MEAAVRLAESTATASLPWATASQNPEKEQTLSRYIIVHRMLFRYRSTYMGQILVGIKSLAVVSAFPRLTVFGRHHSEHTWAASLEESPDEKCGKQHEEEVEPGRVVPRDGFLHHSRLSLLRDEMKTLE